LTKSDACAYDGNATVIDGDYRAQHRVWFGVCPGWSTVPSAPGVFRERGRVGFLKRELV
jgi:hypothetical protein